MQTVIKAWGSEEVFVNEREYCFKILRLAPGKRCSLHRHLVKKETFIVFDGVCRLESGAVFGTSSLLMRPGDQANIPAGTWHRFSAVNEDGCVIWEISTHHDDADVERLEPSGDIGPVAQLDRAQFSGS